MTKRLACSPLTGAIFLGTVDKNGNAFVGTKADMTNDFLRTLIEKADYHGGQFDIQAGNEKWTVTVTKEQSND